MPHEEPHYATLENMQQAEDYVIANPIPVKTYASPHLTQSPTLCWPVLETNHDIHTAVQQLFTVNCSQSSEIERLTL